jgi:hypothetical protein
VRLRPVGASAPAGLRVPGAGTAFANREAGAVAFTNRRAGTPFAYRGRPTVSLPVWAGRWVGRCEGCEGGEGLTPAADACVRG